MKVVGIIVEYNPLHNGHVYHIEETKRRSNCDVLVAVMSGNFMQRGEPAIIDKFTRTKMALDAGIDLVVELPVIYSIQHADHFAKASVELLSHFGVSEIYFGSESGDINMLNHIVTTMKSDKYNSLVRTYLNKGFSYPTANDNAMKDLDIGHGFNQPNNILGIQYIQAVNELDYTISLHTFVRKGTGYYSDHDSKKTIQSATTIRKLLLENNEVSAYVPAYVNELLKEPPFVSWENFSNQLLHTIRRSTIDELHNIALVSEGLEYRIKKMEDANTYYDFVDKVISKRYTYAHLNRVFLHILLGIKKTDKTESSVPYARILGMNKSGRKVLHNIKKTIPIPLITKIKEDHHPYLELEIRATKIYALATSNNILIKNEFKPLVF